ncbi:MAG: KpsF/GutQ family sugar-phosphate isomerase [Planctomycetota bacterium]|nr:KpsF/GutQ family sugar-phosphate isomerase [Planctomycetota bacterium]
MDHLEFASSVIAHEAKALDKLAQILDDNFTRAVDTLLNCKGLVVVTGMGKAHLIGQKISATLASTGTPSFDMHAGEALHGDLGRLCPTDVVIALSNSGKTREVCELIDPVKKRDIPLIAITGQLDSPLAKHSDIVLHIGKLDEACPLGLAPSTTTTAMLALGDALALTVQKAKNFRREDYAFFHPAGELGRKLMKVSEIMRTGTQAPVILKTQTVRDAIMITADSRAGAVSVTDENGVLVGIFTNGDLRTIMVKESETGVTAKLMSEVMTSHPKTVSPNQLAAEAFHILKEYAIDELPVVDENGKAIGMIDVQDFLGWAK